MLWSLNHVLKATVRGTRDSRVSLISGLSGTRRADVYQDGRPRLQPFTARPASGATTFSSVPGTPRQGRMNH